MRCKSRLRIWTLLSLSSLLLFPGKKLSAQPEKVNALKESLAENEQALRQYQWIETTIISMQGEEKSRVQKQCFYGLDGKIQKQPIGAPPQQQAPRGLKGKVDANKKEELTDYMKQAVALVHQYVPPDSERIQTVKDAGKISLTPSGSVVRLDFRDYLKPGDTLSLSLNSGSDAIEKIGVNSHLKSPKDVVTLDVSFASLNDGTFYPATIVLTAPAKNVQVVVQNSDYGHR